MVSCLRLCDIPSAMETLAIRIRTDGFVPDHVLYIESAGRLLGHALAGQFGCSSSGITARRTGNRLKQQLGPLLGGLPAWLAHGLRRIELDSGYHKRNTARYVELSVPLPPGCQRLVVVDDAVDSGHSLQAVVCFLEDCGFARADVLTAAVTVTGRSPVVQPDICLHRYLITFPWSPGSPDWPAYRRLREAQIA